jgi:prepilin-type N-terminal cleavage/methylation domain-containing protein
MKRAGFTLIELLIVVTIIGIIASIAVTSYVGSIKKAERSEAYANLNTLRLLEEAYFADRAAYAPSRTGTANIQLDLPGFRPDPNASYTYATYLNAALPADPAVPYGGAGSNVVQTPCFVAIATAIADSRVAGDVFAVDCNNNKNY